MALGIGLVVTLSITLFIAFVVALSIFRMLQVLPSFTTLLEQALTWLDQRIGGNGIQVDDLIQQIDPVALSPVCWQTCCRRVLSSISLFSLVLLIIVFMLVEIFVLPQKIDWQIAQGNRQLATAYRFTHNIRQYVSITSLLGLAGGAVLSILLIFLGVEFAVMWGILFFVMNFVPMVGFWVAMIPPVLLALVQSGPTDAIVIFLAYVIVNFLVNQVFKPALMRGGLDLSPLWSIMSLVIWSAILGPLGFILGVPLTIALKELVLENDEDAHWVADILGARVPTPLGLEDVDQEDTEIGHTTP